MVYLVIQTISFTVPSKVGGASSCYSMLICCGSVVRRNPGAEPVSVVASNASIPPKLNVRLWDYLHLQHVVLKLHLDHLRYNTQARSLVSRTFRHRLSSVIQIFARPPLESTTWPSFITGRFRLVLPCIRIPTY